MKPHPLKVERELRGWSQARVAEAVGTSVRTVIRWEQGQSVPYPYYREQLCSLFSKNARELGLLVQDDQASHEQGGQKKSQDVQLITNTSQETLFDPAIPVAPGDSSSLVGRESLLKQVKQLLWENDSLNLIALQGLPGIGKTALVVALAADPTVRDRFTGGILWAGLGQKPDVLGHLARWGKLLEILPTTVADVNSQESWGQVLRAAIGQRRFLLVIDDAWGVEEALAFQVGGERCAHLLTSRLPQVAFAFARERALVVPELQETDALTLLARYVPDVIKQDHWSAQALVQAVGSLPLALTLMGNYLAAQAFTGQARRLRDALIHLQHTERRLHVSVPTAFGKRPPSLPAGIPFSLHSVIALSDQHLSTQAHAALRALSVFPPKPNSFSEEAALAVTADSVETLDALWDAGLLASTAPGRYTLHQTIVDYAHMQGQEAEPRQRLVTFMVWFVRAHEQDYEALEREQSNILAALGIAEKLELSQELLQGVMALVPFMRVRGHYTLASQLLLKAFQTTLSQKEKRERLSVLRHQASFAELRSDYVQAERYSQEGLRLARELGDQVEAEGAFLTTVGLVAFHRGDYARAKSVFEDGLQQARKFGDRERICTLLIHLGGVLHFQGDFSQAEALYQEGLVLARQIEHFELMPLLLTYLGTVSRSQGRYLDAERYFQEGLSQARSLGHREHLVTLLNNLGVMTFYRGNLNKATEYYLEGLALVRQMGLRAHVGLLLSNLGEVAVEQNDYIQAEEYLREGISLAHQLENRNYLASLLAHLGSALGGRGNFEQANACFQESLDLARSQGSSWHISKTLVEWGELRLTFQQLDAADAAFQEVLIYERNIGGDVEVLARIRYGLARVAAFHGKVTEAARLGLESEKLFEKIGHFKAGEVRDWLLILPKSTS